MELEQPIVSIIIPCYNAEQTVSAAIDSAANSSIASRCELIIVNDGSTDQSRDVIDAACKQTGELRIKVIQTEHRGVSGARNTALENAEGKYIAFLDADDRISSCMLENMVAFSEERGEVFSYCAWTPDLAQLSEEATIPVSATKERVFSTLLYRSISLGFTCVLYRRDILEKYGLRFDDMLRYGEDLAFLWEYALHCSAFLFFQKPFYYYARNNTASAMHRVRWEMTDVLKAVDQIRACIPQEESALQKEYDAYMIPRYILYLQKGFAAGNNRALFDRLRGAYPSVSYGSVIKKARFIIKISAVVYRVSPIAYFHLFRLLRLK